MQNVFISPSRPYTSFPPTVTHKICNKFTAVFLIKFILRSWSYSTSQVHLSWPKNNCEPNLSRDVFHQNSTAVSDRSISLMSSNIKSALRRQKNVVSWPRAALGLALKTLWNVVRQKRLSLHRCSLSAKPLQRVRTLRNARLSLSFVFLLWTYSHQC